MTSEPTREDVIGEVARLLAEGARILLRRRAPPSPWVEDELRQTYEFPPTPDIEISTEIREGGR